MKPRIKFSLRPVQASWRERGRRGLYFRVKLTLGTFEFEVSNGSLYSWSHFNVHRHEFDTHVVAGRLSVHAGRPGLEPVTVCAHCNGLIERVSSGEESWDVCESCRTVEGPTHTLTRAEFEAL